ncbi:MAG: hypothetical protein IJ494_01780 [Bacteroides sp.]|nr:hypothetical protein [Bacteroides sp.]
MLARQQNQWNIEQWNRENAYNSPTAQMSRFKAAGLNPDLIYGQSNTSGQISGSLTSGAPASPTDYSAMGRKTSPLAAAIMGSQQYRMQEAQIRGMEADADKKEHDAHIASLEDDVRSFLQNLNVSDANIEDYLNQPEWQSSDLAKYPVRKALHEFLSERDNARVLSSEAKLRELKHKFESDTYNDMVQKRAKEAGISEAEYDFLYRTLETRIQGVEANVGQAQTAEDWSKLERILAQIKDIPTFFIGLAALGRYFNGGTLGGMNDGTPDVIDVTESYDNNGNHRTTTRRRFGRRR